MLQILDIFFEELFKFNGFCGEDQWKDTVTSLLVD